MGILKEDIFDVPLDGEIEVDVNPNAGSYAIQLQPCSDVECVGGFVIKQATGGSVDSVKVGDVELLTASIPFTTDEDTTAGLVAANIAANGDSPFNAAATGPRVDLTAKEKGNATKGQKIVVKVSDTDYMIVVAEIAITYAGLTALDPADVGNATTGTYTVQAKPMGSLWYEANLLTDNTVKGAVINGISVLAPYKVKVTTAGILASVDKVVGKIIHYT